MNRLVNFILLLGMLVIGTLVDGGLWLLGWHSIVMPAFHVHNITYAMACGLDALLAFAVISLVREDPEVESDFSKWMTDKLKTIAGTRLVVFVMIMTIGWWIAV